MQRKFCMSCAGWMALAATCYRRNRTTLHFLDAIMDPNYKHEKIDEVQGWQSLVEPLHLPTGIYALAQRKLLARFWGCRVGGTH